MVLYIGGERVKINFIDGTYRLNFVPQTQPTTSHPNEIPLSVDKGSYLGDDSTITINEPIE
jgi:hypothetical protein